MFEIHIFFLGLTFLAKFFPKIKIRSLEMKLSFGPTNLGKD